MKFAVIVFPGSNCDEDVFYVLRHILAQNTVKIWHKDADLQGSDFVVLPGGFSYGDYLRCGAIARFSPIMESIIYFAAKGGYVVGICNGFQVLTESGLLPGVLLRNTHQKFICANQYVKPATKRTVLTKGLEAENTYNIPIAHAEGRYYASTETLKELEDNDQVLFHYVNKQGDFDENANPNGSCNHIAGICNKNGNVMGLMPHPERASSEILGNIDGKYLFHSILDYA